MLDQPHDKRTVISTQFELGQVVATPSALSALESQGLDPVPFIARHARCDWGDEMSNGDWVANDRALQDGERLLSAYDLPDGRKLWIITEADRTFTTVLLPEDY